MANMGINFACSNVRQQIDSVLTSSNLPIVLRKYILMDMLTQYEQLEDMVVEREKNEYLQQLSSERDDKKNIPQQKENAEG